jgi:hypothetical protein
MPERCAQVRRGSSDPPSEQDPPPAGDAQCLHRLIPPAAGNSRILGARCAKSQFPEKSGERNGFAFYVDAKVIYVYLDCLGSRHRGSRNPVSRLDDAHGSGPIDCGRSRTALACLARKPYAAWRQPGCSPGEKEAGHGVSLAMSSSITSASQQRRSVPTARTMRGSDQPYR